MVVRKRGYANQNALQVNRWHCCLFQALAVAVTVEVVAGEVIRANVAGVKREIGVRLEFVKRFDPALAHCQIPGQAVNLQNAKQMKTRLAIANVVMRTAKQRDGRKH